MDRAEFEAVFLLRDKCWFYVGSNGMIEF